MLKKTLLLLAVSVLLVAGFSYLPLPGFEAPYEGRRVGMDDPDFGLDHFEKILAGQNLDRPFPEMPVRADNPTTPERVALGRLLYFDPVLSGDNTVSCAHCHHPDLGFSDNRELSMGIGGAGVGPGRAGGAVLRRNSPTVWNAAYNHRQFWDGRATDLEDQAAKPIQDASEMAQDPDELVRELRAIPAYVELFDAAFDGEDGSGVTFEHVTYAVAAFERTVIADDAPFDRYARGDHEALSPAERRGLNLFRSLKTRCFECHNLPTFNNPDFKVVGVPDRPDAAEPDLGRAEVAGAGYERAFKVPTLRNVALTAPYMHNGVFQTLGEVVDFYAGGGGVGLGLDVPRIDDKIRPFALTPQEKANLIAFLHALTDESRKPEIPARVPSGLPVVQPLLNQSPELAAYRPPPEPASPVAVVRQGNRLVVEPGGRIQDAVDAALPGDTVAVRPGTYHETLTVDRSDLTLLGLEEGGARPVLDGRGALPDGLVGTGSRLEFRNFEVRNYTANGLMINMGRDVVFRDLLLENTGLYGVYPVEVVGVTVERCTVTGARDAGIYVGQSKDIVVRESVAYGNVTGIEIENSVNAVVEDNDVYDNTAGILVFGLPNNPSKLARNCRVVRNRVIQNNRPNFGDPSAIVSRVPAGSGVVILAADETEVTGNEIRGNHSYGVAVSGLDTFLEPGANYDLDPAPDRNRIHRNAFLDNGGAPDPAILEAGFAGADLLWDLSGDGNRWDEPGASRLPYALPGSGWSDFRRRANVRLWRLAMRVL